MPRPTPKGRGSSAPAFWRFHSTYAFTVCHRTTKFEVVTSGGRDLGISNTSGPKRAEFQHSPIFCGSPVFMPTPFITERSNSLW